MPVTRNSSVQHAFKSNYIIVKAPKSSRALKIAISFDSTAKIHYNLNTDGDVEILPVQYGSGKYTVSLYHQISGSKYQKDGEISFTVKMKDKLGYTLYPNQWVNYTAETAAVQYADELCADLTDEYEITMAVFEFMKKNFSYDWFKSGDVKAGTLKDILPDIDGSWETGTGICQDIAAIMCAMLRSQGIHTRLVVGTCHGTPHAWVTVYYHGDDGKLKSLSLDPTFYCKVPDRAGYKAERYAWSIRQACVAHRKQEKDRTGLKKPLEEFPKGHHAGSAYSVMMRNRHGKTLQTLICKVCVELFIRFAHDESGTPTIGSSFYF